MDKSGAIIRLIKFDDYTMKTIEVIERTNALAAAGRTCFHLRPVFFADGRITT